MSKQVRKTAIRSPSKAPPAYVCALHIENVRCFGSEPQELSFCTPEGRPSQWTVLLGNNGTGKTTLLECLARFWTPRGGVFSSDQTGPPYVHWASAGYDYHLVRLGGGDLFSVRLDMETGARFSNRSANGTAITWSVGKLSPASWQAVDTAPANTKYPGFYAYGAGRSTGTTSLSDRSYADSTSSLFDDSAELRNAEEWLLNLDYSASKQSHVQRKQKERLEQVRELLIHTLPDVKDIRISDPTERHPQPAVEFKTPDGWVPLRWTGYGYRSLVTWLVDFASRMVERYPRHKDPLKQPAVVLVDEIDLHLHPIWQRDLMRYVGVRFPNTQFIVTAHSPIFVQAASEANIVVLRRDEAKGHVVIDNSPEAVRGWRLDQILTSNLFGLPSARPPEIESLLIERKKILSKSRLTPTDKAKLKKLQAKIGVLPAGETSAEARTTELLDRTLKVLEKQTKKSKKKKKKKP